MTNKEKEEIALFRYGILAPLITGTASENFKSNNQFFQHVASKVYTDPKGETLQISPTTLKRWYHNYKKGGLDALRPKGREDFGISRKIDVDISKRIQYYKQEFPNMPSTLIHSKLIQDNMIKVGEISLSSVTRHVKKLSKNNGISNEKVYLRYEKEDINALWYGDTCHGPYITFEGKRIRSYIIALIDDASRMIVGIDAFTNDNTTNLFSVMKSAVSKYGKPKMFSFDNGSNYKNKQIELVVARLESVLSHTQPYTPQSKGKIERWFRTLRESCLSTIKKDDDITLEQLRDKINAYVVIYNNTMHTSLNDKDDPSVKSTPQLRFFSQPELINRLKTNEIEQIFLFETERKVSNDGIISIDNKQYEVESRYANMKLTIRYSYDMKHVYIVNEDRSLKAISLVNKVANSKIKRKKISLSQENN